MPIRPDTPKKMMNNGTPELSQQNPSLIWGRAFVLTMLVWALIRIPLYVGQDRALFVAADLYWLSPIFVTILLIRLLNRLLYSLIHAAAQHPKPVLGLFFLWVALAVPGIFQLGFVRIFDPADLPPNDPLVSEYMTFVKWKGQENSFLLTYFSSEGVTGSTAIRRIAGLEDRLKRMSGVIPESVQSIVSVPVVSRDENGDVQIQTMRELVESAHPPDNRQIRQMLLTHPLLEGRFVSTDGKLATILVRFNPATDTNLLYQQVLALCSGDNQRGTPESWAGKLLRQTRNRIMGYSSGPVGATGFVLIDVACLIAILFVATILTGLALAVMFVFLLFLIGRRQQSPKSFAGTFSAVLFTIGPLTLGPIILVTGLLGWLGIPIDTITGVIPVVLIAIASSYGIHIAHQLQLQQTRGGDRPAIVARAIVAITPPVLLSGLTTAIGFATLAPFAIESISRFGTFAALAVMGGIVPVALLVGPAWFALFAMPAPVVPPSRTRGSLPVLQRISGHPLQVLLVTAVLTLLAVCLFPRLQVGSQPTRFLDSGSLIPRTTDSLNRHFAANGTLFVALDSGRPGGALEPDFLAGVASFSQQLGQQPSVAFVQNIAEILAYLNLNYAEQDDLPATRQQAAQLLMLYDMAGHSAQFVDQKRQKVFLYVAGNFEYSQSVERIYRWIHQYAARHDLHATVGSEYLLWVAQTSYLVQSKIISWMQGLLLIMLVCAARYDTWKAGVAIGLPLFAVTSIILALMALFGIPLDIASTVITSIAIGVGADFSIHMHHQFRQQLGAGADVQAARHKAIAVSAPPVLQDAASNILGFSTFLLASLIPIRDAGILLVIAMVLAALGGLIVVPALLPVLYKPPQPKEISHE